MSDTPKELKTKIKVEWITSMGKRHEGVVRDWTIDDYIIEEEDGTIHNVPKRCTRVVDIETIEEDVYVPIDAEEESELEKLKRLWGIKIRWLIGVMQGDKIW